MTTTGLGAMVVVVGVVTLCLDRHLARMQVDFLRGFLRLDVSERGARRITWSYYACSTAFLLGGIVLIVLVQTGAVSDRPSSGNGTAEWPPVVGVIVVAFMVATLVLSLVLMVRSWRRGGPARSALGERPASVAEELLRERAAALAPPGLALDREEHTSADGTVIVTRSYRHVGASKPEAVLAYYRSALPPLGWTPEINDAAEHDTYRKTVDGRSVRYVVAADDRGASTRMWSTYFQGLWVR